MCTELLCGGFVLRMWKYGGFEVGKIGNRIFRSFPDKGTRIQNNKSVVFEKTSEISGFNSVHTNHYS